jgi:hypothetical protein
MDVNERLALEIGKPALRAVLAEAQNEQLNATLQQALAENEDLKHQLQRKADLPDTGEKGQSW